MTTSLPRRIPPSMTTSTSLADGLGDRRAAPGSAAGVPSRLLPPWLDTEIAVTPASTARLASSTRHHALEHERSAPLLAQPGHVVPRRRRRLHPRAVGLEERRRRAAPAARSSAPSGRAAAPGARRVEQPARPHEGLGTRGAAIVRRSICWGIFGLPQSRPWQNDQSSVRMSPTAPAAGPAPSGPAIESRSPAQYIWKKVCGLAAMTSSMRLAGERAEAHRHAPGGRGAGDGHLPVGVHGLHAGGRDEHGHRHRLPHHRRRQRRVRAAARRRTGRTAELVERGGVVAQREAPLGTGDQGAVHRLRQALAWPGAGRRPRTRTTGSR